MHPSVTHIWSVSDAVTWDKPVTERRLHHPPPWGTWNRQIHRARKESRSHRGTRRGCRLGPEWYRFSELQKCCLPPLQKYLLPLGWWQYITYTIPRFTSKGPTRLLRLSLPTSCGISFRPSSFPAVAHTMLPQGSRKPSWAQRFPC